MICTIDVMT